MRVTKITIGVGVLIYVFLWVLALHGAASLIPMLSVPVIVMVLVALGVALQRFIGITPRSPKFDETPTDGSEDHSE